MMIDGEKYACEACVRGHRVSNCRHEDRQLIHIQKKGRPVSQCQHCRAARKSRSAHVKCDCGEKSHKCVHLQPPKEGHTETCCCNHGAICTCAFKTDLRVTRSPEFATSDPEHVVGGIARAAAISSSSSARRRRAHTSNAESASSTSAKSGMTQNGAGSQRLKRGATMNGTGSTASLTNRSVDDLFHFDDPSPSTHIPGHSARLVRSEQASPMVGSIPSYRQSNGQLPPPLDLSGVHYAHDYTGMFNSPSSLDPDGAIFSARAGTSAAWNTCGSLTSPVLEPLYPFDLPSSCLNSGEPTLAPNSGNVSEAEDFASPWDSNFDAFGSFDNYAASLNDHVALSGDIDNLALGLPKDPAAGDKFAPFGTGVNSALDDAFWAFEQFPDGLSTSPEPIDSRKWSAAF
ncbi:hypothetical protein F5Y17DRAFT_465835 [Xylariaceae sp. FL0594]|nr:hypothetical protein F5Y17DRAFT_465835 [Xylariaceae sp. FL0594]